MSDIYGLTIGYKYSWMDSGVKLVPNEILLMGKRKENDKRLFILDEGFTLDEVVILSKYYNIVLALVETNALAPNIVGINRNKKGE